MARYVVDDKGNRVGRDSDEGKKILADFAKAEKAAQAKAAKAAAAKKVAASNNAGSESGNNGSE